LRTAKNNKEGILHDGMKVVRQYGRYCNPEGEMDEKGTFLSCTFDYAYYPEIARDIVPSPAEYYQKYAIIDNKENRLKAILGDVGYDNSGKYLPQGGGFKSIGEGLKNKSL